MSALIPEVAIVRDLQQSRYPQWIFAQIDRLSDLVHHPHLNCSPWIRLAAHIHVRKITLIDLSQNLTRFAILLDDTDPQWLCLGYNLAQRPAKDFRPDRAANLDRFRNIHNGARRNFLGEPETALRNGQWKRSMPVLVHHSSFLQGARRPACPSAARHIRHRLLSVSCRYLKPMQNRSPVSSEFNDTRVLNARSGCSVSTGIHRKGAVCRAEKRDPGKTELDSPARTTAALDASCEFSGKHG